MQKQSLKEAIAYCRWLVEKGAGTQINELSKELICNGIAGLRTIEIMLSEPGEQGKVEVLDE